MNEETAKKANDIVNHLEQLNSALKSLNLHVPADYELPECVDEECTLFGSPHGNAVKRVLLNKDQSGLGMKYEPRFKTYKAIRGLLEEDILRQTIAAQKELEQL